MRRPFYGVLALAVAHLMRRHAAQAGIRLSVRGLDPSLGTIEGDRAALPSTGGRPKARRIFTDHDETAAKLTRLFGIEAYATMS